jgi:protein involved in temperature-dependent protein secretion
MPNTIKIGTDWQSIAERDPKDVAAEIDRLRAALDRIAFCGAGEDYRALREIARKALGRQPGQSLDSHVADICDRDRDPLR